MLLPTNSFWFILLAMEFDAIIPAGKGSFQPTNHTANVPKNISLQKL